MNQSLDGYVDHLTNLRQNPRSFAIGSSASAPRRGSVYGRRMYEIMRYWDEDHPEWNAEHREFAAAWRSQPKWVVSRSLTSVGPNATLVPDDMETVLRGLKTQLTGDIAVAGPKLAQSLTELGLIDDVPALSAPRRAGQRPRPSSPAPGHRSVLSPATGLARA